MSGKTQEMSHKKLPISYRVLDTKGIGITNGIPP